MVNENLKTLKDAFDLVDFYFKPNQFKRINGHWALHVNKVLGN